MRKDTRSSTQLSNAFADTLLRVCYRTMLSTQSRSMLLRKRSMCSPDSCQNTNDHLLRCCCRTALISAQLNIGPSRNPAKAASLTIPTISRSAPFSRLHRSGPMLPFSNPIRHHLVLRLHRRLLRFWSKGCRDPIRHRQCCGLRLLSDSRQRRRSQLRIRWQESSRGRSRVCGGASGRGQRLLRLESLD